MSLRLLFEALFRIKTISDSTIVTRWDKMEKHVTLFAHIKKM